MGAQGQDWDEVVGLWYASALGDVSWRESLRSTSRLMGGAGGAFFELDRDTGTISLFEVDGLEPGASEYVDRMNAINPRMLYSLARPAPHVVTDYDILPETEIRRHEFYDWMERTNGTRYFVGARIADAGPRSLFASIEFDRRRGNPDRERVALFRRLAPHIGNAWRIARVVESAAEATDLIGRLAGSRQCGIVGLAGDGRITFMNPAAEATFRRGDALVVTDGHVRALRAAADRTLQALLLGVLAGAAGGMAAIPAAHGEAPLAVRITPTSAVPRNDRLPSALLLISDPHETNGPSEAALRALGLTTAEARVAEAIARGHALPHAARNLGISHNTARAHLRAIFAKTGVRSQVELARVLAGLAGLGGAEATETVLDCGKAARVKG
jgi:DNA-binding CsgD family transcriptional regulator